MTNEQKVILALTTTAYDLGLYYGDDAESALQCLRDHIKEQSDALAGAQRVLEIQAENALKLACVIDERDALRSALRKIHGLASRALADPASKIEDGVTLFHICTVVEEAPKCPACDDGLAWHEKEPGFQQWSTRCGVCGGTGRSK